MRTTQGSTGGWDIPGWCEGARIKPPTYHTLTPECKPHSTTIGKRRVIYESPLDWLARMAEMGGAKTTRMRNKAGA